MAQREKPLVTCCQGATPGARLAGEVVEALGGLGAGEALRDLDAAVAAARGGRRLVAVDGCESACCTRTLGAKGVRPFATLNVAELTALQPSAQDDPGRIAAAAAARLRRPVARPPRHTRPTPPAAPTRVKGAHGIDDYLLAIDTLASTAVACGALASHAPTLASHVSRMLGVSRASAGEMLARLESAGLVERGAHKELSLTEDGRAAADRAVRRHRVLECLAGDLLGYPLAECYERARLLAGSFDDDAIDRASRALGDPERCPHGWPVDAEAARAESRRLAQLSTLAAGERATIVRIAEHDGGLLDRASASRLLPGTEIEVRAVDPLGVLTVRVHGERTNRTVAARAAAELFVLR